MVAKAEGLKESGDTKSVIGRRDGPGKERIVLVGVAAVVSLLCLERTVELVDKNVHVTVAYAR